MSVTKRRRTPSRCRPAGGRRPRYQCNFTFLDGYRHIKQLWFTTIEPQPRPRDPNTTGKASLFLVAYGFSQSSIRTSWHDRPIVRKLTSESLSVERHGAGARNNFNVLKLQRLASRRQGGGIFDLPPVFTILEDHLRPFWLRKPVIACVYRELKHGRSGDEVRPRWRVN